MDHRKKDNDVSVPGTLTWKEYGVNGLQKKRDKYATP
jgi:hypothetical protein